MKKFVSQSLALLLLVGFSQAHAAKLVEIEKPTGVKVKAAFNYWEKIYNQNMCYPNAWAYSVKERNDSESWEDVIQAQVALIGKDNEKITIEQLVSPAEVTKASIEILSAMFGSSDGAELDDKLLRVFEKKQFRQVYYGTTGRVLVRPGKATIDYNGYYIAIVDLEENEVVIIGYGDGHTFDVRDCDG